MAVSQSLAQVIADLPTGGGGTTTNVSPAIEANTAAITALATQHVARVWSTTTNYMDGDGVMWEIISRPYNTLTCVQADAHPELLGGVWSEAIHPIWPAPGFFSRWPNERYPLIVFNGYRYTADWSEWYIQEQYQRDLLFIDVDGNSAHQNPFEMYEMNYAGGSIWMLKEPAGVTTNIITRLATTNDIANSIAQLDFDALLSTQTLATVVAAGNHTATNVPGIDDEAIVSVRAEEAERIALYGSATVRPGVEAYSTYAPALIARSATGPGALLIQGPVSNSVAAEISGELLISSEPTANEGAGQPGAIRLGGRAITSWDEIEAQIDQSDINALNAWGRRLPDGTPNAASNTAVVINTPMIIASGLGFETSGNYAVCITAGAEMQVVTNGGWVCIKPSTWTDGIGFRTISMTVPAIANSFNVVNGGKTNGYAQIKFAYTAGETNAPPVSYSTDLLTWAFAPEQEATQDGAAWTVTVAADQPRMYFKGEGRTGSADRIYSAYPHTFDQGIAVGTLSPVVYDAVITVEHGGKSYRLPAQEVQ